MPIFVADEIVTATKLNAGTIRDWTTWSPTLANLTLGSGVVTARYGLLGSQTVFCYATFVLGAGSAVGSAPSMTLPVAASASYVDFFNVGESFLRDATGNVHTGAARFNSTSRTVVQLMSATTANQMVNVTATVPFTWASGDTIGFSATYEAA